MKQMKYLIVLFLAVFVTSKITAQAPGIDWKNVYPHIAYTEYGSCIEPTDDGGYIVGAVSASNSWIFKLDSGGTQQWDTYLPNDTTTGITNVSSIKQTTDHGYIVAGTDMCTSGTDSIGNHGVRDFMVMKMDENGDIEWIKTYGGTSNDIANSVDQTADGGYIVAGYSGSTDGDAAGNAPWYFDAWIIKLDALGNLLWQKSYGGSNYDYATSVRSTSDGGYVVAGYSGSKDGEVSGTHWGGSDDDMWVLKLDASGDITWQYSYGGSEEDQANAIHETSDGGFIVAGSTASHDGLVTGNHNIPYLKKDFWVIKITSTGILSWQKCYGGTGDDFAYSVEETTDGGFIVGGTVGPTDTVGVDITGYHGNAGSDYWVVKLNAAGNLVWQKCLGGHGQEDGRVVRETTDGGYIIVGTEQSNDGDVAYTDDVLFGHTWIVKLGGAGAGMEESGFDAVNIYPNPTNGILNVENIPGGAQFHILDLSGKTISHFENTGDKLLINTSDLANGLYFIQFEDKGKVANRKFVVRK